MNDFSIALLSVAVGAILTFLLTSINYKRQNMKIEKDNIRSDRIDLFKTLMANRYIPVSYEKTKAFNLIEIVFYDCDNVKNAWKDLYNVYSTDIKDFNENKLAHFNEEMDEKMIALLESMALVLNYNNINWLSIKKHYTPMGISNDISNENYFKKLQMELIENQVKLSRMQLEKENKEN